MLPIVLTCCGTGADDYLRKLFDGAEFQALDRTISCLILAWQSATLRRHLGTEQ